MQLVSRAERQTTRSIGSLEQTSANTDAEDPQGPRSGALSIPGDRYDAEDNAPKDKFKPGSPRRVVRTRRARKAKGGTIPGDAGRSRNQGGRALKASSPAD